MLKTLWKTDICKESQNSIIKKVEQMETKIDKITRIQERQGVELQKQEVNQGKRSTEQQNMDAVRESVNKELKQHSLKQENEAKRLREEFNELLNNIKLECKKTHENVLRKQEDEEKKGTKERQSVDAIRKSVDEGFKESSLKQENEAKRIREEFNELLNKCKKTTDCHISKLEQFEKNIKKLTEAQETQNDTIRDLPGIVRQYGHEEMTRCFLKMGERCQEGT